MNPQNKIQLRRHKETMHSNHHTRIILLSMLLLWKKDQAYPTIRKLVAISQEIMVWPFILPPFYYLLRNKKCVFGPSSFFYRVSEKALLQKCLCLEPCLVVYNLKKSARGHTRTTVPCKVAEKTSLTLRLVSCEKTTVHATVFSRQ